MDCNHSTFGLDEMEQTPLSLLVLARYNYKIQEQQKRQPKEKSEKWQEENELARDLRTGG